MTRDAARVDPLNSIPDDPEPRRRGCSVSVLPYLVVALVVLWRLR